MLLGFEVDQIAIFGEVTDQRIDMAQSQLRAALQIAAHEAVVLDPEIEGRGASVLDRGHTILLG